MRKDGMLLGGKEARRLAEGSNKLARDNRLKRPDGGAKIQALPWNGLICVIIRIRGPVGELT